MAYTPPLAGNITFNMPSPYTAPTAGSVNIIIGGVTTTVIDMDNAPLSIDMEVDVSVIWYSAFIPIEGSAEINVPDITLCISVPPIEVNTALSGSAQQRVICEPLQGISNFEITGIQQVPEDYTVLSPWPFLGSSLLSMDGIALTVVDSAFNTTCSLENPLIEANGEAVIDTPALECRSEVSSDIMPSLIVQDFQASSELYCMAVKSMPAGDTYLACPPFQVGALLEHMAPIFGFSMPPLAIDTQISISDVYQGDYSVLEPLVISNELYATVSAAVSVSPLQLGSDLAPDFAAELGIEIQPLEASSTLSVEDITIGTFVELVPLECRGELYLDTQVNIWLFNGVSSEINYWGHFRVEAEVGKPDIIKTVICPGLAIDTQVQVDNIKIFTLDLANQFYYFTLTGAADSLPDVEIPISSFQCRMRNDAPTFLQVVIPGLSWAPEIEDRSNGDLEVYLTYKLDGDIVRQQLIASATIDGIRIDEGVNSSSITLTGYKTETYTPKEVELTGETYKSISEGKFRYRLATPSLDLTPGDTVTVGGETFTAEVLSYYFRATKNGMTQNMEVAEA